MSFIGSFGMFTTVRLGIYTSQQGLNLTGNNIANINTVGYTRQTLNIQSMNATGVDRYMDSNTRIGSGAYVTGISQMRDPYLDIRYRTEAASVGYMDTKLSNLNDLAAILDEVGSGDDDNGIISAQLSDLLDTLEKLTEYTGQGEFDTQVRSSAASLVALFNSYANKLDQVEINAVDRFNQDVVTVNELLKNIQNLSTQIRTGDIHGTPGLEMRDERNRLIDELSQYIKIDVRYESENIAPGVDIEKIRIKLADHYNPEIYLVDGVYAVQLQHDTTPTINPNYDPNALPYLDDADQPTATATDKVNPASLPYLSSAKDASGNYIPVADPEDAAPSAKSNYDLKLSALADNRGNLQTKYLAAQRTDNITATSPVFDSLDPEIKDQLLAALTTLEQATAEGSQTIHSDPTPEGISTTYSLIKQKDPASTENNILYTYSLVSTTSQVATETRLADNDLYGSLQAAREFLTEEGEFATTPYTNIVDPGAATKRGVRYYKQSLDLLARKFADTMNEANNGFLYSQDPANPNDENYYYLKNDGTFLTDDQGNYIQKTTNENLMKLLEEKNINVNDLATHRDSGNLFSIRGDTDDATDANGNSLITAANISISARWASGDVQVVNSYVTVPGTMDVGSTDNTNILHMVTLMNKDLSYVPSDLIPDAKKESMFIGSFGEMLSNINAVLGNDQKSTQIMLDNYYEAAVELDTNRDSVSSVDLNDETVNMIQYQKSYSAACRLMTTMDEILDKLINGTGVAGR